MPAPPQRGEAQDAAVAPRPRISPLGLLPLFVLAHFGHHVAGAIMRPLLPMVRSDLGLSYTRSGFLLSAFAVANGASQLPGGWLADKLGTRLTILISVSGVAAAGSLVGLSHSFTTLVVLTMLGAVLAGGYHPAASATIAGSFAPQRRGRALGLHLIGGSSAFWVVPLLAAPAALAWGWRGAYVALTVPAILLGLLLYASMGGPRRQAAGRTAPGPDTAPGRMPWASLLPFMALSVGTATLLQSVSSYMSLYAVDALGVTEAAAAVLTAISPAVGLVAGPLGGYLSDRAGRVKVLMGASLLGVPLVYFLGMTPNFAALAAFQVLIGLVTFTRMPASEAYIAENTPASRRSTMLGVYFFAGAEIGGLLTPVVGYSIDRLGFSATFAGAGLVMAAVTIVCGLLLWRASGRPGSGLSASLRP